MSDPLPAPSFNLTYNIPPTDIGSGYAAGISKMGESIASGITGIMGGVNPKTGQTQLGILGEQRQADDLLAAMKQTGQLTQDQYDAVAGKSLGAKQQLIGQFSTQWAADQAQQRAIALAKQQSGLQIGQEHAKMLDQINLIKSGYGDQSKLPYRPPVVQQQQNQPVVQTQQQPTQLANAPHIFKAGSQVVLLDDGQGNKVHGVQNPDGSVWYNGQMVVKPGGK